MKKFLLFTVGLFACVLSQAKTYDFVTDLDFTYHFDNREFALSDGLFSSWTYHAIGATPSVGFEFRKAKKTSHRFMTGVDVIHNMGYSTALKDTPTSFLLYYCGKTKVGKGIFSGTAGVFPANVRKGEYSEAIFSDKYLFLDRCLEGTQLSFRTKSFYSEIGLDWMGGKSETEKERFQIYSAGYYRASNFFGLGWAASMYHYASSGIAPGVAENHILNPYMKFDFGKMLNLTELSLKTGALVGYERDRVTQDSPDFPVGFEAVLNIRHKSFGTKFTGYVGQDLQPLRNMTDTSGTPYGDMLYFGSPTFSLKPIRFAGT